MDQVFDAAWSARFGGRHAAIEGELATLVDVHGGSLADQPKQVRLWLTQACPDATRQVAALVAASEAGVATRLRGASDDGGLPALFTRSVGELQRHGVDEVDWAWWAVRTWAHAFALPTSGPAKAPIAPPAGEARAAIAPWMVEAPATTPARAPAPVARATPRPVPPSSVSAPAVSTPTVAPTPATQVPVIPIVPVEAMAPVVPVLPIESVQPATLIERVDPTVTGPVIVDDVAPATSFAPIEAPPVPEPTITPTAPARSARPVPAPTRTGDDRHPRQTRRPAVIAAVVVLALVVLAYGAWQWTGSRSPSSSSTIAETVPPTQPQASAAPAAESGSSSKFAGATAPSSGPSNAPSVAEVVPSAASVVTAPGAPPVAAQTSPSSPPAATSLPPSVAGAAAEKPGVPVAASQQPPAPAARRPVIARIDVPRIVDGESFAVVVHIASDPKDVARIERHVTPATGTWPRSGSVEFPAGTRVTDALAVPFRGIAAPAQATVEFVAIGRDGSRSPPGSVRLTVMPAARVAAGVASAAPPPSATTAAGCGPTTCGVVTGARQLETGAGVAIYQITVRNDARDNLSFTVPYRLQSGTRVHVNGGRLVPIGP